MPPLGATPETAFAAGDSTSTTAAPPNTFVDNNQRILRAASVVALLLVALSYGWVASATGRTLDMQFAASNQELRDTIREIGAPAVKASLLRDLALIASYAIFAWLVVELLTARRRSARGWLRATVVLVVVADVAENFCIWRAATTAPGLPGDASLIAIFAMVKWLGAAVLVVLFASSAGRGLTEPVTEVPAGDPWLGETTTSDPRGPEPLREKLQRCWAPPLDPATPKVGISCSGGGIRSATFCLGALHGLGIGRVRRAAYLSAVSGGAYTAAAMTAYAGAQHEAVVAELAAADACYDRAVGQDVNAAVYDLFTATVEAREAVLDADTESEAAAGVALAQSRAAGAVLLAVTPAERALGEAAVRHALGAQQASRAIVLPFGQLEDDVLPHARRDSAELARLRARASYLLLSGDEGRVSVARVAFGMLINLTVLYLLLYAAARPIGYVISSPYLHPELRASTPLVRGVETHPKFRAEDFRVATPSPVSCGDEPIGRRYEIGATAVKTLRFDYAPKPTEDPTSATHLLKPGLPGLVDVCRGRIEIVRQPAYEVEVGRGLRRAIEVESGPLVSFVENSVSLAGDGRAELEQLLKVDAQPKLRGRLSTEGRSDIDIRGWMWATIAVAFALAAISTTFSRGIRRDTHGITTRMPIASGILLSISLGAFALFIGLPWLCQEIPRLFAGGDGSLLGAADGANGLIAWLVTTGVAARATLAGLRKENASTTARGKKSSRLVLRLGAMAFLALAGLIVLFSIIQQPVLNGPAGKLGGLASFWWLPWRPSDLERVALVVLLLVLLRRFVPAHLWSLNPLYRDRLGRAFIGDDRDADVPDAVRTATILNKEPAGVRWPQLVICCAANLNSIDPSNRIPSGRWADSFTFSRDAIGSTTTGMLDAERYDQILKSKQVQGDLRYASLIAVSGAAFSPGMGKEAYGAIGGLLAVLNLRLGLWLPNPDWMRANAGWHAIAGWPYLVREIFGRFHRKSPFVYVTDGGHWENIGLVELIRRGCTEIYVLSAAGDGKRSFSTMGEAIALAREQVGVDIRIELGPLRSRQVDDADDTPGGQLIRQTTEGDVVEPYADSPFAIGWFTYANGERARILFVEANLTADIPWDVQSHAERHLAFPDDSTANQMFNHRQFESYRRLGIHQAEAAVSAKPWTDDAQQWVEGSIDEPVLIARLQEARLRY